MKNSIPWFLGNVPEARECGHTKRVKQMDSDDLLFILLIVGYIFMWVFYLSGYGGEHRDSLMLWATFLAGMIIYRHFFD